MNKFLLVLLFFCINNARSKFCFWNTRCPYKYFATKTSYSTVRGDIRDSVIKLKGCEPVSIWSMYRHGMRKPVPEFQKKIKEALPMRDVIADSYKKGRSSLCAQDVENLLKWEFDNKHFDGKPGISEEGRQEMSGIAKRLKQAFPDLLKDLRNGSYTFRSAKDIWLEQSVEAFVKSLEIPNLVIDNPKDGPDVMRPYAACAFYEEGIADNLQTYAESNKLLNTSEYRVSKSRIQRRSGLEVTDQNINMLYNLCRFTSGKDDKVRPWCAVFTKKDLEILEYAQDLRQYYRNGYGPAVNPVFGRIPLGDMFTNFESVTRGRGKKIIVYVTHTTILGQMYTTLGLFKDSSPLTAAHRDRDRKWRTSKIVGMAANFVAVLNRCAKEGSTDYNVAFYLNEKPIRSICADGVCSWEEFETTFRPFVNTTIDFCGSKTEKKLRDILE